MSGFSLDINFNTEGWGPKVGEHVAAFEDVPYAHFDKKDRVFRHADNFNLQNQSNASRQYQRNRYNRGSEDVNAEFSYKHDNSEDSTFKLVDTAKSQQNKSKFTSVNKRNWTQSANAVRAQQARNPQQSNQGGGRGQQQKQQQNRWGGRRRMQNKVDRLPSVAVRSEWEVMEEIDLVQLNKLQTNKPKEEDLTWCGHLDQYDDAYEKTTTKSAKTLKRSDKLFYGVTTTEDPVIENFALEKNGNVFATDAIVAQLMAASRSVYSWDIVIQKMDGMLFLDKRENSTSDLLSVSETAHEPPSTVGTGNEDEDINLPEKLSVEATMINQSFSQQILRSSSTEGVRKSYDAPNPFFEDDENDTDAEPASVAYRYRKFTMGDIDLVVRCELHAWTNKRGEDLTMTCHALNEWDSKFSGGMEWRQKIDQQRGAVLATELKNNSCKLGRWAAQSILAGADLMKLGYVSRKARTNPYDHAILATQFFKPKDLATQIAMTLPQMWGVIKMICDLMMKDEKENGKYVLLRDPNKPIMRLYSVPPGTFESDDESDDESEEGSDEESDEDI